MFNRYVKFVDKCDVVEYQNNKYYFIKKQFSNIEHLMEYLEFVEVNTLVFGNIKKTEADIYCYMMQCPPEIFNQSEGSADLRLLLQ